MTYLEKLRKERGLTQAEAAHLIHSTRSSWQDWLRRRHKMPRALRELFILKAGSQIKIQVSDKPTPKEIEDYRRMAGLSISDAAKMVYVSQSAWSDWEAGHKTMHKGLLEYFILTVESKGKLYM
jgi:DNA-binding transcriptional regulator YiaG